ncbi:small ribosomal subunit protein mS26-like [Tubulanus polymorphus]|uniref:small ribosomal subunit protein mS26-like n=1 Tax=Tubulanus polymorphus TaxID=672921 RepID=UPI003DA59FF8
MSSLTGKFVCETLNQRLKFKTVLNTSVRWRKPMHLPRAKTKFFVVREVTPEDPEERAQLKKLYDHYRTYMKSIGLHLSEEIAAQEKEQEFGLAAAEDEAEEARLMELNDLWNNKIKTEREVQFAHDIIDFYKDRQKNSTWFNENLIKNVQEKEDEVDLLKEDAGSFITMETLDAEIEKLLDSDPVSYNFALDTDGSVLVDDVNKPYHKLSPENSQNLSIHN